LIFLSKYCRVTFSITHVGVFQPVQIDSIHYLLITAEERRSTLHIRQ
jgi:hypothetical protein